MMLVAGDLPSLNRPLAAGTLPRPMTTPADGESLSPLFVRLVARLPTLVDGTLNPNLPVMATPVVGTIPIHSLSTLNVRNLPFNRHVSLNNPAPSLNLGQSTMATVAAGTLLMWACISPMQL